MDFKNSLSLNGTDVLTATTGYTRTHLSTSGQSSVHWGNLTSTPTTLAGYGIAATDVTAQALTGYVDGTNAVLTTTDSILAAFGKVQAQLNAKQASGAYLPLTGGNLTGLVSTSSGFENSSNSGNSGITGNYYKWGYQEAGAWTHPYPDLVLAYHTGMKFGANTSYGGMRFYADHPFLSPAELFSIGNGDTHVRVANNLYVGGNLALHAGNVGTYALGLASGGYYQASTWIQFNTANGLYWPWQCGTHLYPSATTYGAFTMTGSKGGWAGVSFNSTANGVITFMCSTNSAESGMHNETYGWQIRWAVGTLYVGKGTYGGSEVAVLDASNYSSYALPLSGGATTGNVGICRGTWTGAALYVQGPGTTASTYGLIVTNSAGTNGFWINDAGTAYVRNSPVTFSDARLKAAIEPLTGALAIVCAIPARSWRWKDDLNGPTRYGPIAQETELVAPELVVEGSPGPGEKLIPGERPLLSLRGDSLLGLVHGAIHELAARVAALESL